MRIGELMIMNGIIVEEQLQQALQQQQVHAHKKIGEILIEQGDITERQLVEVLEFQIGVPVIQLAEAAFQESAVHLIKEKTAKQYGIIPLEQKNGSLKLVMSDPLNQEAIKQITKETGLTIQPLIATRNEVEHAITIHYGIKRLIEEIYEIIQSGVNQGCTYIHFVPEQDELVVQFQIRNKLLQHLIIPKDQQRAMIERIKIMSGLNAIDQHIPQEGRLNIQNDHKPIHSIISTLPTINGESIQIRILNLSEEIMALSDLGLSNENSQVLDNILQKGSGMVLVACPPNSGQTSTLYAILNHLRTGEKNVISLEDPVEHRLKGITQVEVNPRMGFSYTQALQHALKRNPNIIMIDDLMNKECLELAAQASLSNRLMLCGSQAHHAIEAIRQMIGLSTNNDLLASSIKGVIAQRLVRRVCKHCAQTVAATDDEVRIFEQHQLTNLDIEIQASKSMIGNFRTYVTAQLSGKTTVIHGSGCQVCNQTGYYGYVGIQEVLDIDELLKSLIHQALPEAELKQYLQQRSFRTMLYDGLREAREGITTVEEVLKVVHE